MNSISTFQTESEASLLQQQRTPPSMTLSGTQKTLIAISLALVVLKKRNAKRKTAQMNEENHVFERKKMRTNEEVEKIVSDILSNILNPILPSAFHESLLTTDPIFHFDVAVFSYEPSSILTKHTLIQLNKCLKTLTNADHNLKDFKEHVKTKILQKTFSKHETTFKGLLCVLWDVSKDECHGINQHSTFYIFIDAIVMALGEVSSLEEIPVYVTDSEIAKRTHILVFSFSFFSSL